MPAESSPNGSNSYFSHLHLSMALLTWPQHLHLTSVILSPTLPFVPLFLQFFLSPGNQVSLLSLVISFPFVRLSPNPNMFMKTDKSNHRDYSLWSLFYYRLFYYGLNTMILLFYYFLKNILFLERGKKGESEGENHQCEVVSHALPTGEVPATQACALTGNWTSDPLVHRLALSPLSQTSQGYFIIF